MKPVRKTRHALMFMGAGAVAAYFFDPESGPDRRERMMQQIQSLTGGMQSGGQDGESSSTSDGDSAPSSASADAFSSSSGDDTPSDSGGPIDLATGKPVSQSAGA